jgi:hypothetical protein
VASAYSVKESASHQASADEFVLGEYIREIVNQGIAARSSSHRRRFCSKRSPMLVETLSWNGFDATPLKALGGINPQLVVYFGSRLALSTPDPFEQLKLSCPGAHIIGCSTGGQTNEADVFDDAIACVAIRFANTRIRIQSAEINAARDSRLCGRTLGLALLADDLAGIFVLSDGLRVNGSELTAGITDAIGREVKISGGLAGDGSRFETTLVGADFAPRSGVVVAIGFYGSAIRIGHGSAGGWDVFGPYRSITKSEANVLYELDGKLALDLYERYLGPEAEGLPGTGLLFPLQIQNPSAECHTVVRTILSIDREARSLTFAGDMPVGWRARFMRGNFDRLTEGAAEAARQAAATSCDVVPDGRGVALLVSCIGRRLLMGQQTADEVEASSSVLGDRFRKIGFYSYGEIAPHHTSGICELHNQTMTITTLQEISI